MGDDCWGFGEGEGGGDEGGVGVRVLNAEGKVFDEGGEGGRLERCPIVIRLKRVRDLADDVFASIRCVK